MILTCPKMNSFLVTYPALSNVRKHLWHMDSKVHGANMSAPDGSHVGPMNFAIWDILCVTLINEFWYHFRSLRYYSIYQRQNILSKQKNAWNLPIKNARKLFIELRPDGYTCMHVSLYTIFCLYMHLYMSLYYSNFVVFLSLFGLLCFYMSRNIFL